MCPLIYHVNAFCGVAAAGNPGAVCLLDDDRPAEWMQMIADQMNPSQTGFVRQLGPAEFTLRWFSPTHEVPLCGHVTLGAAHALWNEAALTDNPVICFQTASGPLRARRLDDAIEIALVPYWSEILGKPVIRARQASRRGGEISGRLDGDRVLLTGRARTVLSGRLLM